MPREYKRADRVADFVKREVSILLQQELRDPRVGTANINDVVVSRDMSHAKIHITFIGVETAEEAKEPIAVLNGAAGFLRSQLAAKSSMRSTPKLRFYFDESVRSGERLSNLIDKAVASTSKNES